MMKIPESLMAEYNRIILNAEHSIGILAGEKIILHVLPDVIASTEETLKTLVCNEFRLSWGQITSRCRKKEIKTARQVYCWLVYKYVPKSRKIALAKEFGQDHTTVLNAIRAVNNLLEVEDAYITLAIEAIVNQLKQLHEIQIKS